MKSALLRPVVTVLCLIACGVALTVYAQAAAPATVSQTASEYRNDKFQFSLSYPADMTVSETDERGGAQTISFMDEGTGKQFNILAIPYSQLDIAGDAYSPHDAFGTADQGLQLRYVNVVASDVVQIWFVKLGVLYEVLTMEGDEAWLTDILKTWQFE